MDELAILFIFLAVIGLLSGPIALILALVALAKSNQLAEKLRMQQMFSSDRKMPSGLEQTTPPPQKEKPSIPKPITITEPPPAVSKPVFVPEPKIPAFEVVVPLQGTGFSYTGMGGWVYIKSQNTLYSSASGNPIYTRTRRVGYTNDVDWVRWTPTLPHTGYYNVYVYAPHYSHSMDITQQARYKINHAGGTTTVTMRQSD